METKTNYCLRMKNYCAFNIGSRPKTRSRFVKMRAEHGTVEFPGTWNEKQTFLKYENGSLIGHLWDRKVFRAQPFHMHVGVDHILPGNSFSGMKDTGNILQSPGENFKFFLI